MDDSTGGAGTAGTILVEPERKLDPWTVDDLPETVRTSAAKMGWTKLMPVQASASPYLMAGRDMIVQSRTGSGKTGAFLIPLLLHVNPDAHYPQGLVLVPTRELALQVYGEFEQLAANLGLKGVLVYGGVGYGKQLDALKGGAQVVIGTPGRVLDHIGRRSLNPGKISTLVFDEADEMLSMGFYPDMKELRRYLPRERRTWMFSATMPYKVQMLAEEFMRSPEFLSLSVGQESVDTMEHRWYNAPTMEKDQIVIRLIEMERPDSAIIFCNMKSDVEYVANVLKGRGYSAEMLSGDLSQNDRERVMRGIRENRIRFLVATDVAARGIDISDLSHVILYDIPKDQELYLHRAGRTARAGNTGMVLSLVGDMGEKTMLKKIGRKYGIEFVEMPTPTDEQVVERIGERLLVCLEDRWRNLTPGEQSSTGRLERVAALLGESENGRQLMGMLLADLYRETFNAPQSGPDGKRTEAPATQGQGKEAQKKEQRKEGEKKEGEKKEGGKSKSAPAKEAPAKEDAEPQEGGEAKKKKKRRRPRKKSDDAGTAQPTDEQKGE